LEEEWNDPISAKPGSSIEGRPPNQSSGLLVTMETFRFQ
jgi:hypothetical protein